MAIKSLGLFSGNANRELAEAIAHGLGTKLGAARLSRFSDGEFFCQIEENVRGVHSYVIQPTCSPVNDNLIELLIMVDALRRASAGSITAVLPYYGYARQDRKMAPRTPITSRLIADLLQTAGVSRVLCVDLHAAQIQGFFDGPVDHLFAMPVLLEHMRQSLDPSTLTVVSPDMGRVRVADIWSDKLGAPLAIIHKRRDPRVPNQVSVHEIVGEVEGRVCLLVDDLIDTGKTIVKASEALKAQGALRVVVAATHAVFSDPAVEILQSDFIDSVVVTDTLPIAEEKRWDRLTVLPIAPLIARAIHEVFDDGSVTSMFDGAA